MLIKGFAVVAGRKRLFLLGVFVLAAMLGVVTQSRRWESWLPAFAVTLAFIVLMLALSLLATRHYHPAVLFVRPQPPAFATAVSLSRVFTAAAFILLGGGLVGESVADIVHGEEFWYLEAGTAALMVLAVALHLYVALGSFGVRLEAAGLHDRQPFSSLFIPWEAFAPGYPAVPANTGLLTLYYERPDLIRRRGLRQPIESLPTATDATYLAAVIQQYVASPEHRPAIGTEAELRRLATLAT